MLLVRLYAVQPPPNKSRGYPALRQNLWVHEHQTDFNKLTGHSLLPPARKQAKGSQGLPQAVVVDNARIATARRNLVGTNRGCAAISGRDEAATEVEVNPMGVHWVYNHPRDSKLGASVAIPRLEIKSNSACDLPSRLHAGLLDSPRGAASPLLGGHANRRLVF